MVKELYVARHGETVENVRKILQGHLDGTLSENGLRQAYELGVVLADQGIEFILCGDLGRQKQTANEIRRNISAPIEYVPFLRERGGGSLEGKAYSELEVSVEENFDFYGSDGKGMFVDVESIKSIASRAKEAVDKLIKLPDRKILTIGSGWINSYIVNLLLGEPWTYHHQGNAVVHYFKLDDAGRVLTFELNKKKW